VVAYNTLFLRFEKNDVIFREGDDANCLFIVSSGKVEIKISGKAALEMKPGESFG
jgi:CRP-like cAMP-binding protein